MDESMALLLAVNQKSMQTKKKFNKSTDPNPRLEKGNGWKEFFTLGEAGAYFFRKKDASRPSNINIKMMHGINKISVIIFLLGVIYIIIKRLL